MNGVSIMISAPDLTTGDVLQRSADDYLVQEVSKLLDLVDSQKESCGTPVSISDSEPVDKLAERAARSAETARHLKLLYTSLCDKIDMLEAFTTKYKNDKHSHAVAQLQTYRDLQPALQCSLADSIERANQLLRTYVRCKIDASSISELELLQTTWASYAELASGQGLFASRDSAISALSLCQEALDKRRLQLDNSDSEYRID